MSCELGQKTLNQPTDADFNFSCVRQQYNLSLEVHLPIEWLSVPPSPHVRGVSEVKYTDDQPVPGLFGYPATWSKVFVIVSAS